MTIQNKNKFQTASNILGNIWVSVFLIIITLISSVAFLSSKKIGWLLIAIPTILLFILTIIAKQKNKDRFIVEQGYNLLRTSINKKVGLSKERIIVTNNCLLHKKQFIIGFEISFFDLLSLSNQAIDQDTITQEVVNQSFVEFCRLLPIQCNFQLKIIKNNAQIPEQMVRLNIQIESYARMFEYQYILICKTTSKQDIEKIQNYIFNSYFAIEQLNTQELINSITL